MDFMILHSACSRQTHCRYSAGYNRIPFLRAVCNLNNWQVGNVAMSQVGTEQKIPAALLRYLNTLNTFNSDINTRRTSLITPRQEEQLPSVPTSATQAVFSQANNFPSIPQAFTFTKKLRCIIKCLSMSLLQCQAAPLL